MLYLNGRIVFTTLVDETGIVRWVSHAIPPLSPQDILGNTVWHFAAPGVAREIREAFYQSLEGESVQQSVGLSISGIMRYFLSTWRPARIHDSPSVIVTSREIDPRTRLLSRRQFDVLQQVAENRSNAEASLALGVSVRTIESHLRAIRRILKISTRQQLIAFAANHFLEF